MSRQFKILLIDDDLDFGFLFKRYFKGKNIIIDHISSEKDLSIEEIGQFDLIYVDFQLKGWALLGDELITNIAGYTTADFCLMSTTDGHETHENVVNPKINAMGIKFDQEFILNWFEYTKEKRLNLYDYE